MNLMEAFVTPKREFYQYHVENGCGYRICRDGKVWKIHPAADIL
jgi:alpha-ribazole phosphatase